MAEPACGRIPPPPGLFRVNPVTYGILTFRQVREGVDPLKPEVFSETLVHGGGEVHFGYPANSKTKDATKTKLRAVIVRHISIKN